MSQLEANKRLALEFLRLSVAYRIPECLQLLHEDATWWVIGKPDRLPGAGTLNRTQIERLLRGFAKRVPEPLQLTIKGVTAEGDRVAVEAEARGRWRKGTPYHNTYHFLFEMQDGAIRAIREYMDTLHVFDVIREESR